MITQHETFRQAATRALESLANKVFELIGQQVSKWLAGELAETAATVSGEAAHGCAVSRIGGVDRADDGQCGEGDQLFSLRFRPFPLD